MDRPTIQVRAPKFELYQFVTLYWNELEIKTKIVRRWLALDDDGGEYWWYKVTNDEQLYPEQALEPRYEA